MQELCNNLLETYQDQLIAVILFGSQARGDATPDSDFDVLVILKDLVQATKEIEKFLVGENLSFSKHSAVISKFGELFARTSKIDPKFHRYLIDAEQIRLKGDYPGFLTSEKNHS